MNNYKFGTNGAKSVESHFQHNLRSIIDKIISNIIIKKKKLVISFNSTISDFVLYIFSKMKNERIFKAVNYYNI